MKKLINDPADVVTESAAGFAAAHAGLVRLSSEPLYFARAEAPTPEKVALVSGGGSGHEPLHGGFVGPGMLDAAVPGPVFTSPTPDPVLAAIDAVDGGAGILLIVKNYTGDVLNFETAAELAAAEGKDVRSVVVADDVAVSDSLYTAGRRGVAGTVVVEKIAGAAAERGDTLEQVAALAETAAGRVRSLGVALSAGTVPHTGEPSFLLTDDEVEFGVGIHGEPGRERISMAAADALTERAFDAVLDDLAPEAGAPVLLMVNGLGGTPEMELNIVFRKAAELLSARGLRLQRSLIGTYVTSLDMAGFSLSLLLLDPELLDLWDAPVATAALRWGR